MAEAGIKSKAQARQLLTPSWGTHVGFEAYQLSNNGANIRRLQARLDQLARAAKQEHKERMIGNSGIKIIENVEANRLQIIYPGKPDAETRAKLKSHGFRWAPSEGAWQRQLNNAARWAAEHVTAEPL